MYLYLKGSLDPEEEAFFKSVRLKTVPVEDWMDGLKQLSIFLAWKSRRGAMVFIDKY